MREAVKSLEHSIFYFLAPTLLLLCIAFFNLAYQSKDPFGITVLFILFSISIPVAMYLIFSTLENNLILFSSRSILGGTAFVLSIYLILEDDFVFNILNQSFVNYSLNDFLLMYLKFFTHLLNTGLIVIFCIFFIVLVPDALVSFFFSSVSSCKFPSSFFRVIVLIFVSSMIFEYILTMFFNKGLSLE